MWRLYDVWAESLSFILPLNYTPATRCHLVVLCNLMDCCMGLIVSRSHFVVRSNRRVFFHALQKAQLFGIKVDIGRYSIISCDFSFPDGNDYREPSSAFVGYACHIKCEWCLFGLSKRTNFFDSFKHMVWTNKVKIIEDWWRHGKGTKPQTSKKNQAQFDEWGCDCSIVHVAKFHPIILTHVVAKILWHSARNEVVIRYTGYKLLQSTHIFSTIIGFGCSFSCNYDRVIVFVINLNTPHSECQRDLFGGRLLTKFLDIFQPHTLTTWLYKGFSIDWAKYNCHAHDHLAANENPKGIRMQSNCSQTVNDEYDSTNDATNPNEAANKSQPRAAAEEVRRSDGIELVTKRGPILPVNFISKNSWNLTVHGTVTLNVWNKRQAYHCGARKQYEIAFGVGCA